MLDLIVRGGSVVGAQGVRTADVAIENGQVVAVEDEVTDSSRQDLDADGLHLFPGLIDVHVHFNEPGRADWEGIRTGSSALAAGGGTVFADMPLNSHPPVLSIKEFEAKRRACEASSITDFALWAGLTPDNLEELPGLAEAGAIGFKAFMSNSGIPEFKAADDLSLYRGMQIAAKHGVPVAVHAESEALTSSLSAELRAKGGIGIKDFLASRPVVAELESIGRALLFAEESGCELHVVHVSTAKGVDLIRRAKTRGVKVSAETCPHYLTFNADDLERHGAVLKCAPPLRSERERAALYRNVLEGHVDLIASDHSPCPPELKRAEDFFEVWGGIAGVQTTLAALWSLEEPEPLALSAIARLTAYAPAKRFGLAGKGRLAPGCDADFSVVDLRLRSKHEPTDLLTRHGLSPYLGGSFRGRVERTYLRGRPIYQRAEVAPVGGRFLRPERMS